MAFYGVQLGKSKHQMIYRLVRSHTISKLVLRKETRHFYDVQGVFCRIIDGSYSEKEIKVMSGNRTRWRHQLYGICQFSSLGQELLCF